MNLAKLSQCRRASSLFLQQSFPMPRPTPARLSQCRRASSLFLEYSPLCPKQRRPVVLVPKGIQSISTTSLFGNKYSQVKLSQCRRASSLFLLPYFSKKGKHASFLYILVHFWPPFCYFGLVLAYFSFSEHVQVVKNPGHARILIFAESAFPTSTPKWSKKAQLRPQEGQSGNTRFWILDYCQRYQFFATQIMNFAKHQIQM